MLEKTKIIVVIIQISSYNIIKDNYFNYNRFNITLKQKIFLSKCFEINSIICCQKEITAENEDILLIKNIEN